MAARGTGPAARAAQRPRPVPLSRGRGAARTRTARTATWSQPWPRRAASVASRCSSEETAPAAGRARHASLKRVSDTCVSQSAFHKREKQRALENDCVMPRNTSLAGIKEKYFKWLFNILKRVLSFILFLLFIYLFLTFIYIFSKWFCYWPTRNPWPLLSLSLFSQHASCKTH